MVFVPNDFEIGITIPLVKDKTDGDYKSSAVTTEAYVNSNCV